MCSLDGSDPFTMELQLCDDDGIVRHGAMHHGTDYPCTSHAHFAGEHIRCTSPAHACLVVNGQALNGWQVVTAGGALDSGSIRAEDLKGSTTTPGGGAGVGTRTATPYRTGVAVRTSQEPFACG